MELLSVSDRTETLTFGPMESKGSLVFKFVEADSDIPIMMQDLQDPVPKVKLKWSLEFFRKKQDTLLTKLNKTHIGMERHVQLCVLCNCENIHYFFHAQMTEETGVSNAVFSVTERLYYFDFQKLNSVPLFRPLHRSRNCLKRTNTALIAH